MLLQWTSRVLSSTSSAPAYENYTASSSSQVLSDAMGQLDFVLPESEFPSFSLDLSMASGNATGVPTNCNPTDMGEAAEINIGESENSYGSLVMQNKKGSEKNKRNAEK
ncbi:hypothetical protein NE237_007639 [Protea cynaroides]|uniref:Uncharacterized protein n=1 Tax=Protea cynaroides TaxID=273540 RepID=A0A9Q0KPV9_9MAGN|nr:hypothetical protein NE237_007639 [Protea cynaroides]